MKPWNFFFRQAFPGTLGFCFHSLVGDFSMLMRVIM
jgi:hypothetical protein